MLVDHHEREHTLNPEELTWSTMTYGLEDTFAHMLLSYMHELAAASAPPVSPMPVSPPHAWPLPTSTPMMLHQWMERQLLHHLLHMGVIVFTMWMYLVPMMALVHKGVPVQLATAVHGVKGLVWTHIVLSAVVRSS